MQKSAEKPNSLVFGLRVDCSDSESEFDDVFGDDDSFNEIETMEKLQANQQFQSNLNRVNSLTNFGVLKPTASNDIPLVIRSPEIAKLKKVKNFTDLNPFITQIFSILPEYQSGTLSNSITDALNNPKNETKEGVIDILPFDTSPPSLIQAINKLYRNKNFSEFENFYSNFLEKEDLCTSSLVQIDIIRYAFVKEKINLLQYNGIPEIDPKVTSLLYFLLSTSTQPFKTDNKKTSNDSKEEIVKNDKKSQNDKKSKNDKKSQNEKKSKNVKKLEKKQKKNKNEKIIDDSTKCAFIIKSLLDFVKNSSMAPISVFHPTFDLDHILIHLCDLLLKIFPHHPLVPSILHRFSDYVTNKDQILKMIKEEDDTLTEEEDSDFDFSSDFFDDLKPSPSMANNSLIQLDDMYELNPLDLSTYRNTGFITMKQPPLTVTYTINSNITPSDFLEWARKYHPDISSGNTIDMSQNNDFKHSFMTPENVDDFSKIYQNLNFLDIPAILHNNRDLITNNSHSQTNSSTNENSAKSGNTTKKWALFLPLYHFCLANGIDIEPLLIPDILQAEYNSHCGLELHDNELIKLALKSLVMYIHNNEVSNDEEEDFEKVNPSHYLFPKRKEYHHETNLEEDEKTLLAIIDIALILSSRSPITFQKVTGFHQFSFDQSSNDEAYLKNRILTDKTYRHKVLFYCYSTNDYLPPYVCFRSCFALGIMFMESNQQLLASRYFFEGLSILYDNFPSLKFTIWPKIAFLCLGEALDACDKYFFASICFDNSWTIIATDPLISTRVAKICHNRQDNCRAVFFFTKALEIYQNNHQNDEALYTAQLIASIYKSNDQLTEGIRLLSSMIINTYKIEKIPISKSSINKNSNDLSTSTISPNSLSNPSLTISNYRSSQKTTLLSSSFNFSGSASLAPNAITLNLKQAAGLVRSANGSFSGNNFNSINTSSNSSTPPSKNARSKRSKTTKNSGAASTLPPINLRNNGYPKPDSINTITTVIALIKMLIKLHYFSFADSLVYQVLSTVENPSILKVFKFLKAKIALSKNQFDDFMYEIRHIGLSLNQRNQKMLIDIFSESLKLMAKAYFDRDSPVFSLFWSEMAIQSSCSLKNSAICLLYRGQSLAKLYKTWHLYGHYLDFTNFGEFEKSFGKFDESQKFTQNDILSECLSSLLLARLCFDRIGSVLKMLEAYLEYCEVLMLEIFRRKLFYSKNISDNSNSDKSPEPEKGEKPPSNQVSSRLNLKFHERAFHKANFDPVKEEKFSITIKMPVLLTSLNIKKENKSEVPVYFETFHLDDSNVLDHLGMVMKTISNFGKLFMNPISVIRSEILYGQLQFLNNKIESAQKFFSFAFTNIQKYFFNGHLFLIRNVSIEKASTFYEIMRNLTFLLIAFEPKFINQNLIVFDMLNDMSTLLRNKIKLPIRDNIIVNIMPITSSISSTILELQNPSFPEFKELELLNFQNKNLARRRKNASINNGSVFSEGYSVPTTNNRKVQMIIILKKIRRNVRSFYEGVLTERKLFDMNANCCKQLENIANEMKMTRSSLKLSELPPRVSESVIFFTRLFNHMIAYFPFTGVLKATDISCKKAIRFSINQIPFKSSVFSISFLQMVASLINNSNEAKKMNLGEPFKRSCLEVSKLLFSSISTDHLITAPIPDDHTFSESKFVKSSNLKGSLSTLNINAPPLTIVADSELQILPFEFMFPNCCVVRSNGFFNKFVRNQSQSSLMRPVVCRFSKFSSSSSYHDAKTIELTKQAMSALGACLPPFITTQSSSNPNCTYCHSSHNPNNYYYLNFPSNNNVVSFSNSSINTSTSTITTSNSNMNSPRPNNLNESSSDDSNYVLSSKDISVSSESNSNNNSSSLNPNISSSTLNTSLSTTAIPNLINNSNNNTSYSVSTTPTNTNHSNSNNASGSNNTINSSNSGHGSHSSHHNCSYENFVPYNIPLQVEVDRKKKYPYVQVVDLKNKRYSKFAFSKYQREIYIFTYADLVDWPIFLEKLVSDLQHSCFLFIPATHVQAAFDEMNKIFKRHEKRKKYFDSHPKDTRIELNDLVIRNSFQFAATLQMTLMTRLKVPVALITTNRSLID